MSDWAHESLFALTRIAPWRQLPGSHDKVSTSAILSDAMEVPVQYFQSVIAIELAAAGALLWQIRYFESNSAREREQLPDPRLRLALALVFGATCSAAYGRWQTTGEPSLRSASRSAWPSLCSRSCSASYHHSRDAITQDQIRTTPSLDRPPSLPPPRRGRNHATGRLAGRSTRSGRRLLTAWLSVACSLAQVALLATIWNIVLAAVLGVAAPGCSAGKGLVEESSARTGNPQPEPTGERRARPALREGAVRGGRVRVVSRCLRGRGRLRSRARRAS